MTLVKLPSLIAVGILAQTVLSVVAAPPDSTGAPTNLPITPPALKHPPAQRPPLYRDTTAYPSLQLTWNSSSDLTQVLHVFPHPILPQIAVVTTENGIYLSEDAGHTWTELPEATAAKVGVINDVVFHPLVRDTFYLASQTNGIWITTDMGKTFTQVADKSKGLASDTVVGVIIYPGDPSHKTLLTVHGESSFGISRSCDGGQTWDVVDTGYHFSRIFGAEGIGKQLYLFGSTAKEPDISSVFTCRTVGEFPVEVVRDVEPTDLVFAPVPWRQAGLTYLTTSDSGLYRIDNSSTFGMAYTVSKLAYPGVDGWSSVGVTWGASADTFNLFLYDPAKLGLVTLTQDLSNKAGPGDDLTAGVTASDGLPVSPLTKEGATLHPNANGTVFYAAANGSLSIGREAEEVPSVAVSPGAFEVASNDQVEWQKLTDAFGFFCHAKGSTLDAATNLLQSADDPQALYDACKLTVTARMPIQPTTPTSVTVDLSRYGGEPNTPLYDDGNHDDGAPNDGVYGLTFAFLPGKHAPHEGDNEWRSHGPGRVAMGVVATYADGKRLGAVAVVDVLKRLTDINLWSGGIGIARNTVEGGVTTEPFLNPLAPKQPAYAPRLHKGDVAVRLNILNNPWTVHFKSAYDKRDIDSCNAISFYVRLEGGTAPKELYLQLRDLPEFSPPTTTDRVPLLNGLVLTANYQRIVVPMTRVLGTASQIQLDHLDEIILSGDSGPPATVVMDGLQANATLPTQ